MPVPCKDRTYIQPAPQAGTPLSVDERLLKAVSEGKIGDIAELSRVRGGIDQQTKDTAFLRAAELGKPFMIKELLEWRISADTMRDALSISCTYGYYQVVRELLNKGRDLFSETDINNAINRAICYQDADVLNELLCNPFMIGDCEVSAAFIGQVAKKGQWDLLQRLLSDGIKSNFHRLQACKLAAECGNWVLFERLLPDVIPDEMMNDFDFLLAWQLAAENDCSGLIQKFSAGIHDGVDWLQACELAVNAGHSALFERFSVKINRDIDKLQACKLAAVTGHWVVFERLAEKLNSESYRLRAWELAANAGQWAIFERLANKTNSESHRLQACVVAANAGQWAIFERLAEKLNSESYRLRAWELAANAGQRAIFESLANKTNSESHRLQACVVAAKRGNWELASKLAKTVQIRSLKGFDEMVTIPDLRNDIDLLGFNPAQHLQVVLTMLFTANRMISEFDLIEAEILQTAVDQLEAVTELFKDIADIRNSESGMKLVVAAAEKNRIFAVRELLKDNSNISPSHMGLALQLAAAEKNGFVVVRDLLNDNSNIRPSHMGLALQLAAANNNFLVISDLLNDNSKNISPSHMGLALQLAAANNNFLVISDLLKDNSKNISPSQIGLALQQAIKSEHRQSIDLLLVAHGK